MKIPPLIWIDLFIMRDAYYCSNGSVNLLNLEQHHGWVFNFHARQKLLIENY